MRAEQTVRLCWLRKPCCAQTFCGAQEGTACSSAVVKKSLTEPGSKHTACLGVPVTAALKRRELFFTLFKKFDLLGSQRRGKCKPETGSKSDVLSFPCFTSGSHLWDGSRSWFPLSSCKDRSCCLTQEQVLYCFLLEEEARCPGIQNAYCPFPVPYSKLQGSHPYLPIRSAT